MTNQNQINFCFVDKLIINLLKKMKKLILGSILNLTLSLASVCYFAQSGNFKIKNPHYSRTDTRILKVSNSEWKKILKPSLYKVAREADTEMAFTGKYYEFDGKGTYYCAVCGNSLFLSTSKFATTCAGLPFMSLFAGIVSNIKRILHTIWYELKFFVVVVILILGIFSMMGQNQLEKDSV